MEPVLGERIPQEEPGDARRLSPQIRGHAGDSVIKSHLLGIGQGKISRQFPLEVQVA
jgi:hypothetical protein